MGINVTFMMDDDKDEIITESTLEAVPRVGEKIWFMPFDSHKSCVVTDVSYWISTEKTNNYQAACVYLKEI